jgi:hypothetical protein
LIEVSSGSTGDRQKSVPRRRCLAITHARHIGTSQVLAVEYLQGRQRPRLFAEGPWLESLDDEPTNSNRTTTITLSPDLSEAGSCRSWFVNPLPYAYAWRFGRNGPLKSFPRYFRLPREGMTNCNRQLMARVYRTTKAVKLVVAVTMHLHPKIRLISAILGRGRNPGDGIDCKPEVTRDVGWIQDKVVQAQSLQHVQPFQTLTFN